MILLGFYIFVCALVGVFGMRLKGGFFLYFLLAILFTPFIAFFIRLVLTPWADPAYANRDRRDLERPVA